MEDHIVTRPKKASPLRLAVDAGPIPRRTSQPSPIARAVAVQADQATPLRRSLLMTAWLAIFALMWLTIVAFLAEAPAGMARMHDETSASRPSANEQSL
jgi:hypothetical protein